MKKYIRNSKDTREHSKEWIDTGLTYWYFTRHGIQPGSVPSGLDIFEVIDRPEGSYFATAGQLITTEGLNKYDIYERAPKDVKYYKTIYYTPGDEETGMSGDSFDTFVVAADSIDEALDIFRSHGCYYIDKDDIEPATMKEFYEC